MDSRSKVLMSLSELIDQKRYQIIENNLLDIQSAKSLDVSLIDRLKVDHLKIDGMIKALRDTANQNNPDGKVLYQYKNHQDLIFKNVTVPFGTILIIYESRPDVTIEAAAMAFKSGNKILLKGGKEARLTNVYLTDLWSQALKLNGFDSSWVQYLDISREVMQNLIKTDNKGIDLIIPRGGDSLIDFVCAHAKVPVMVSGRGNNFVYIHSEADEEMAINIILNGKSRISVCNAIDKVLIDKTKFDDIQFITRFIESLISQDIQILGDKSFANTPEVEVIDNVNIMYEEFLASKIYLSVVDNVEEAISITNKYSGGHSACIVTRNEIVADIFMTHVDCAAVYHNASTRFTDGSQVGFGGEMAISTQKLHFRGPIGIDQLVTNKWMIYGSGQIRN